jgi:hypothetical protein
LRAVDNRTTGERRREVRKRSSTRSRDWYRFAREKLGLRHEDAVAYAKARAAAEQKAERADKPTM